MTSEEQMTIDERYKYLRMVQKRYRAAGKQQRSQLLDEMESVTGLHHKSLIRLMTGKIERKARRRQRSRSYTAEVDDALRVILESMDYICAERVQPNLVKLAKHLARHGELDATPALLAQLERISVSTVRRIGQRIRQDEPRLAPRRGLRQHNRIQAAVPVGKIPWSMPTPGYLETDTVFHSGPEAQGEFVCTLQMIDVATAWSERVAVLGRSYLVMEDGFSRILRRLPFPIQLVHCDNGSEFLNHHLLRFWGRRQGVKLSRSRTYRKNDNRFVEQKNNTLVRAYLGYRRLDTVEQTLAINPLYDLLWLYNNFFQPVMRLRHKQVIQIEGQPAKIRRHFDEARTPFDRLCATEVLLPDHQAYLEALRDQINPRQLRRRIYDQIEHIFSLPNATPGVTEDVYKTLLSHPDRQRDSLLRQINFQRTPLSHP